LKSSSKTRYAVAAMIDLALRTDGKPTALSDIAKRQNISVSYLEQLFARLRQGGLIRSTRGPGGGYVLAKGTADITVADISLAVTEHSDDAPPLIAVDGEVAAKSERLWKAVDHEQQKLLRAVSLDDVLAGRPLGAG